MSKINLSNCKAAIYQGDGKSRYVLWDDELKGFGLRVYPSGRKAFILSYRTTGRKRLFTIGEFGVWTPDQAWKEARRLLVEIEKGHDPKQNREMNSNKKPTFADLHEAYTNRRVPFKKSGQTDLAVLHRYIPKSWYRRELDSFTRVEMGRLHQKIGTDNGPYAANRVIALLRSIFNLGVDWGLLPEQHPNPCIRIKTFPEQKRERFITPDELPRIWKAIEQEPDPYLRSFFMLCLFLGARRNEILTMRWEDLDLNAGTWRIPHTKAGRSHLLPLPVASIDILKSIPRLVGSPWVFPSHGKTGHLVEPKSAWARVRTRAGIDDIRIHDLRRTVGSWLAAQGESLTMIGKVLNHTQPSTTAIYAKLHLDPIRSALERNVETMLSTINASLQNEEISENR